MPLAECLYRDAVTRGRIAEHPRIPLASLPPQPPLPAAAAADAPAAGRGGGRGQGRGRGRGAAAAPPPIQAPAPSAAPDAWLPEPMHAAVSAAPGGTNFGAPGAQAWRGAAWAAPDQAQSGPAAASLDVPLRERLAAAVLVRSGGGSAPGPSIGAAGQQRSSLPRVTDAVQGGSLQHSRAASAAAAEVVDLLSDSEDDERAQEGTPPATASPAGARGGAAQAAGDGGVAQLVDMGFTPEQAEQVPSSDYIVCPRSCPVPALGYLSSAWSAAGCLLAVMQVAWGTSTHPDTCSWMSLVLNWESASTGAARRAIRGGSGGGADAGQR
jgi:hypothetical protein